jgi:hypothetical protein
MSNISTAYDAIRTKIGTTLSTHTELSNPYFVDKDSDLTFVKAWALAFGDGTNTNRQISCHLTIQRDFIFVVTRKIFKTTHANSIDLRIAVEKNLFEDQFLVIKELEKDPAVNAASSGIAKIAYVQDGGLEFVRSDRTDLIMIQTIMSLEYFENIN